MVRPRRRRLLAASLLLTAALALAACGSGAKRRPTAPAATPHAQGLLRAAGGDTRPSPGRDRLAAAVQAACSAVATPPLGAHRSGYDSLRAAQLRQQTAWLTALRARLARVHVAPPDRASWSAYRRAVSDEIALDRIVVADLSAGDDQLGVDAGERQNGVNQQTRLRVAIALHAPCLGRFA